MLCKLCLSEHDEETACSEVPWEPEEKATVALRGASRPPVWEEPARDLVGQTLGHYRLVRWLGSGGMGTVYLAEQTLIHARVALKVLHPHLGRDEGVRARFYAEARTVNLIDHPSLVRIFDINEAPGNLHYFVMEYLEGRLLSQLTRPMAPGLLVHLLAQACDALHATHRAGVVHRDLKPDNLFLVEREGAPPSLKVLDFGVAKALGPLPQSQQTAVGLVLGTPAYMAPEQWTGQPVDGRADIYALGVTGYLLVTGRLPFKNGQVAQLARSRGALQPVPPRVLNPHMPQELSDVLLRALAWLPEDRFASALDFKRALLSVREALPRETPVSPVPGVVLPGTTPMPGTTLPLRAASRQPVAPEWVAHVHRRGGEVEVRCTQLSRGGLFMCCEEPFPRLLTQLEFSLVLEGEPVECVGEVVRHVATAQAREWGMRPGIGVQFINPSPRLRELLRRLRPVARPPPAGGTSS